MKKVNEEFQRQWGEYSPSDAGSSSSESSSRFEKLQARYGRGDTYLEHSYQTKEKEEEDSRFRGGILVRPLDMTHLPHTIQLQYTTRHLHHCSRQELAHHPVNDGL